MNKHEAAHKGHREIPIGAKLPLGAWGHVGRFEVFPHKTRAKNPSAPTAAFLLPV